MVEEVVIPIAICTECRFHYEDPHGNTNAPGIWYDQYCIASTEGLSFDPTDGSLSKEYRDDPGEKYKHCREVNGDGKCSMFVPKSYHSYQRCVKRMEKELEIEQAKRSKDKEIVDIIVQKFHEALEDGSVDKWDISNNQGIFKKIKSKVLGR